ncbi:ribosome small subunit-dependent GTPase A [Chengkuizengella axinellae]|uniref:Small ribosomal subunit biogenesis GTPase RsgA n=1 Tax=Chengkuizengella axinellae TaxID=3064388 RepID=A0ABT9J1W3_9BACL|nr:ribosome small subunit-dependent GTPase A [Chengkuizengella sp. 2205SS18-9]MDP5275570.1 ribosome small subunit-dependent GTPase A [Chengkuizengella sp. 2205SS18-9]
MNLNKLGWNDHFEHTFLPYKENQFIVGRVALEHKRLYRVYTENGECLAEVSGKFRFEAISREDYPAVGDWVVLQQMEGENKAIIHAVLPRKSKFSRKVAGSTIEEQIIAANVDTVFIVISLNDDFNMRRIERYLIMVWESGASSVIILSKADLCEDVDEKVSQVETVAISVPICVISSVEKTGIEQLAPYMNAGDTITLTGSSGVGKSTLVNLLMEKEVQEIQEIRHDDKGKHTTTYRELFLLPNDVIMVDTPGMREFQLWEADDSLDHTFSDIDQLANECYFKDCSHNNEPKCAVKSAIENGTLEENRYESYLKLKKELAFLERKNDKKAQKLERDKWKKIAGDRTRMHRP